MKRHSCLLVVSLVTLALMNLSAFAAGSGNSSALSVGARLHSQHSVFTELPYGDDDVSYLLAWEGHEEDGYWQIAVDYAPDVSGIPTTDYVITPQLNLIWNDGIFIGGLGGLQSYVSDSATGEDWTDFYWQFTLGLRIPLGGLALAVQTYYVFDKWDELDQFEGKDLDYGVLLSYAF